MDYFLAIDIGASSGRHLLGYIENGTLKTEEIYRFQNKLEKIDNHICWNLENLFHEIINGMKKCKEINKIPKSLGIDTWGVDFILLDKYENPIGNFISYRDNRTIGQIEKILENFTKKEIYQKTGIQFQNFNTIYQLNSLSQNEKEIAEDFLMIPDYFYFLLTGKKINEYTNITTTQLFNIFTNEIDTDLINYLKVKKTLFKPLSLPLEKVGVLKNSIATQIGYCCDVIVVPTHDTASAFMSNIIPSKENGVIISSGTWSLIGLELDLPINTELALKYNFTNEGGLNKKYRFLKNIMGMWIIQEVAKNLNYNYSYENLVKLARESSYFDSIIDVNDRRFFNCENMIEEINKYCLETKQRPPKTVGELSFCVYNSLVKSYKKVIHQLEEVTNKKIKSINLIGGGCQNTLLNELLKEETEIELYIGPVEATAVGNIITQMLSCNLIKNRSEAKKIIKNTINSGVKI